MLICTYLGLFLFACLCFYFKFLRLSPTSRDTDRKLVGEKKSSTDNLVKASRGQGIPNQLQKIEEWPSL